MRATADAHNDIADYTHRRDARDIFFYLCIFYFLRIGEIHGTVNPLVGRLTLPGLPRLLLYTRSLLLGLSRRILRSLLPYTRSLLPYTRSLLVWLPGLLGIVPLIGVKETY